MSTQQDGRHWNGCKEIPHIQGQRRSPSKTIGGMNSHLESNPFLPDMLRGLKQTFCAPGPRGPTETETELCLSVSCGGMGQQWSAAGAGAHSAGAGAQGEADLGTA